MGRIIAGVVAGILAAFAAVYAVELIGRFFYPAANVDVSDIEQLKAMMATMTIGAKLFVAGAWFVGAFAGGLVAALIVRRPWAAWTPAIVVALAALANILVMPHPAWMQVSAFVLPLLGGLLARRLVPMRDVADDEPADVAA